MKATERIAADYNQALRSIEWDIAKDPTLASMRQKWREGAREKRDAALAALAEPRRLEAERRIAALEKERESLDDPSNPWNAGLTAIDIAIERHNIDCEIQNLRTEISALKD